MSLFKGEAKGELINLRNKLDSNEPEERKKAAKRVLALMRSGENLSCLFSSMLRCVKTSDMELKKLTYHYLVTYAAAEPEQSIMAVNTFIQDSADFNPVVRALAVRTMCMIKLDTVAEHMIVPLKKTLCDKDPYVRKTAAMAVAKLYEVIPEAVESAQIFPLLLKLLNDEYPMVVSNACAALFEINDHRTTPIFTLNEKTVTPILSAMTACSDWCQTVLLDALAKYTPADSQEANFLIDRLIPFLKHANPAVVIGSFRCIFFFLELSKRDTKEVFNAIIPPFITLVTTGEPEIQFIILRTISLFVHKYPTALVNEIRVFFCKYNDPSYVKMEKLNIIIQICVPKNVQSVLEELDEYCNSVDIGFVKKSIDVVGQVAIKIEAAARRCVDILVRLVKSKIDYAVEEAIIVVTDILRRFPGEFESIISTVCSNIENIKDSKAKAAAIWILGEYCQLIDKVDLLLDPFLDTFHDETAEVQIQLLTALVKVFCIKPDETRDQIQFILNESIKESVLPDVRNRALIYWRLLSADSEATKKTVIFPKHTVSASSEKYTPEVLDELIKNMGNVSGILHVVPSEFVKRVRFMPEENIELDEGGNNVNWERAQCDADINVFIGWQPMRLWLKVINKKTDAISNFALALNKNPFGITVDQSVVFPKELAFGETFEVEIPLIFREDAVGNFDQQVLQFALRTNDGAKLFTTQLNLPSVCLAIESITKEDFERVWAQAPAENPIRLAGTLASSEVLSARNVCVVSEVEGIIECVFQPGTNVLLAKARQNGDSVEIILRGVANTFHIVSASASSLFCQQ